jgi:thiol-disulfide isomerase/thioredoxin
MGVRLFSCLLLVAGANSVRADGPTVEDLLKFRPKQEGVEITTPTEAQIPNCKVEVIKGEKGSGYLLRDPDGKPLRRYFDSDGDRYIDVWSFFLDGQEVYREVDTNGNRKADQYRWLGVAGSKIGISTKEDGKIDRWEQISPEEVSQEILQAVITRDLARLQALLVNEADLKELQLPAAEVTRIKERLSQVSEKFNATAAALINLGNKTQWMHVELGPPQCIPADAIGAGRDIYRHRSGTVLYQANGKADFIQTGEMVLVGRAWKLLEAPVPGHAPIEERSTFGPSTTKDDGIVSIPEEIRPLLDKLREVDDSLKNQNGLSDATVAVRYNLARAAVLEQIIQKTTVPQQQENWVKQLADCLSAAAQNSPPNDNSSYHRLVTLRDRMARSGSTKLAGYVTYREMSADYTRKLSAKNPNMAKIQEEWRERLKTFVSEYPSADDAPDALLQLGMVSEFMGKDAEAKNWYGKLAKEYPASPLSKKGKGCLDRLELDGKVMELAGPKLGTQIPFDIAQLSGKVVIVYYWASWNNQCIGDFAKLQGLLNSYKSKGLELVCVNLDNNQADAVNFLQQNRIDATNLFQPGALDSPLAVKYGVLVLPNLFLVGKDGKVISHSVQINGLEEEIKKLMN